MKIHFIGTSHGYAEQDRRCSSLLLEVGGAYYVFDTGTSVEEFMVAHSLSQDAIRGIFITHAHGDHIGALTTLVNNIASYHKGHRIPLYIPEKQVLEAFQNWMEALHFSAHKKTSDWSRESVCMRQVQAGLLFEDERVKVQAIPTDHVSDMETFAYLIEAEGKRLLVSGDLSGDFHDYPGATQEKTFDVIICEFTHLYDGLDGLVWAALDRINQSRTKRMIFHHVRPVCVRLLKEKYENALTIPYEFARDGLVVEI